MKNAAGDELRVNLTHRNEKTHSLRDGGHGTEGIQGKYLVEASRVGVSVCFHEFGFRNFHIRVGSLDIDDHG